MFLTVSGLGCGWRWPSFEVVRALVPSDKLQVVIRTCSSSVYLMALCLVGTALWAQNTTAEITGIVTGQDGAALPRVSIVIVQTATGQERRVTAHVEGKLHRSLPLARRIHRSSGARQLSHRNPQAQPPPRRRARPSRFHARNRRTASGNHRYRVRFAASIRKREMGEIINSQRVVSLPLNGRRFTDLTLLSDSVVAETRGTRGADPHPAPLRR